jgi:Tol biopolymer transport system component
MVILAVLGAGAAGSWLARREKPSEPDYHQVTFRRGMIRSARFTPDGNTIVYSAAWDGAPPRIYTARSDSPDSRMLDVGEAALASVSRSGELAIYRVERAAGGDLRSNTTARVSLAGGTPRDLLRGLSLIEWGPDGESFAVVRATPRGQILEYPVGTTRLELYGKIDGVRFSPDGRSIACWSHPQPGDTKGKVVLVPLDGKPRDLTGIWADAEGLAWHPHGREVWFTAARVGLDRALYAVDLGGTVRLLARIPGSLTLHDIAADGRVLLTRDLMRMPMRGLGAGAGEERDLSWYDWTFANAITPDGKTVFFNESGEGGDRSYAAFLRPMSGGPAVRLGAGAPTAVAPDGASVLVLTQDSRAVLQVPIGAGSPRTIPTEGIDPIDAVWHPDGRRIFVSGTVKGSGGRWYMIDLANGSRRAVTDEGVLPRRAAVSHDGRWLAAGQTGRIVFFPLEAGAKWSLAGSDTTHLMVPLQWAPDGRSLLYMPMQEQFPRRVYRLDVRTGANTLVREVRPPDSTGVAWAGGFEITPDARYYAYSYAQMLSDLYVVRELR